MSAPDRHLCEPTEFLDYESTAVRDFLERAVADRDRPQREQAVDLYYAVRDGIQYEIYGADLSRQGVRASEVVRRGRGLCIHKSVLFAAGARGLGIPSRLVLVDVRNHLASARLRRILEGDVFRYHCYARIHLDGRWVKATPVFSARLCQLYRMTPLEFDGETDAVLQPFDEEGKTFMELIREHGEFDDLPYETLIDGLRRAHGALFDGLSKRVRPGSLVAEAGAG